MRMARCGRNVFGGSGCSPLYSFRAGHRSRSGTIDYAISMPFAVKVGKFMERAPQRPDSGNCPISAARLGLSPARSHEIHPLVSEMRLNEPYRD